MSGLNPRVHKAVKTSSDDDQKLKTRDSENGTLPPTQLSQGLLGRPPFSVHLIYMKPFKTGLISKLLLFTLPSVPSSDCLCDRYRLSHPEGSSGGLGSFRGDHLAVVLLHIFNDSYQTAAVEVLWCDLA